MTLEIWIALAVSAALVALALRSRDEIIEMPSGLASPSPGTSAPAGYERDPRLPALSLVDRDTGFFGTWSEGHHHGCRVAFQSHDKGVAIIAGDFDADDEQLSDIYLSQVGDWQLLPADGSAQRLAVALGAEGAELDERFFLNATGGTYWQLRLPAVRRALVQLSDGVAEVSLFESGGVELTTHASATAESIARDLDRAIELARALAEG